MKKTIAQQLNVKTFPFHIKNDNGNEIYSELSNGYWAKYEYDDNGNQIYLENSKGDWYKSEYDDKGNEIYYEHSSTGFWCKREHNDNRNVIYYEDSNGQFMDHRPKSTPEYTMEELTAKLGHSFKIKK